MALAILLLVNIGLLGCQRHVPVSTHVGLSDTMLRAERWLDSLELDPVSLQSMKVLGKKKLGEKLAAYYLLWKWGPAQDRPRLVEKAKSISRLTENTTFHNMGLVTNEVFRQESTSYLRIIFLLDKMSIQNEAYHAALQNIKPRLDADLRGRGPWQQRVFSDYYKHFGWPLPSSPKNEGQGSVLARHLSMNELDAENLLYQLTHDVFAIYFYGEASEAAHMDKADRAYLVQILPGLIQRKMTPEDVDILAELLQCLWLIGERESPTFKEGARFLLRSQNADGSWGDYSKEGQAHGEYVQKLFRLHTVNVVLAALGPALLRSSTIDR